MPMNEYGYNLDDDETIDEILYEWEALQDEKIIDQDRWHTYYSKVVKSPLGVPYQISWAAGSTEYQECDPGYQMTKVKPVQKTITTYVVDTTPNTSY